MIHSIMRTKRAETFSRIHALLTKDGTDLLTKLTKKLGVSKTAVIELAIREMAKKEDITK